MNDTCPETKDADQQDPVNTGLPRLDLVEKPYSFFEFWPAWLFYFPVVFYWLYLAVKYRSVNLPLQVNPSIFLSGMVGESKAAILDLMTRNRASPVLAYCVIDCDQPTLKTQVALTVEKMAEKGLSFPVVIKPDLGCRGSGVRKVHSEAELGLYLAAFPENHRYIVQCLAPYNAEAGIFYVREPGAEQGKITSITLKYRPYLTGDGVRNIGMLIDADPRASKLRRLYRAKLDSRLAEVPDAGVNVPLVFAGSHCRGAVFRDGNSYISDAMTQSIQACLSGIPDFHYGRLDVKFKDLASLQAGVDFCVIEVNGASSEATHIWDARTHLRDVFRTLFGQYRTLFVLGSKCVTNKGLRERYSGSRYSVMQLLFHWLSELKAGGRYPESF